MFVQRRPAPPLHACVDSIWACENPVAPRALERILPTAAAQLVVNLDEDQTRSYSLGPSGLVCHEAPGCILSGVATGAQLIDTDEQTRVVGVVFRPGGTLGFCAVPGHELTDRDVPLEVLWDARATTRLRDELLAAPNAWAQLDVMERALASAWRARAVHPAVAFAVAEFQARPCIARIGPVTDATGLSPKRFIERFRTEVGVTPKRFCRLLRFQQVVKYAHGVGDIDWTRLAIDSGYYDQPHLIHDFRAFAGMTPTEYEASRTAFQNHVTFLQAADDGVSGESGYG